MCCWGTSAQCSHGQRYLRTSIYPGLCMPRNAKSENEIVTAAHFNIANCNCEKERMKQGLDPSIFDNCNLDKCQLGGNTFTWTLDLTLAVLGGLNFGSPTSWPNTRSGSMTFNAKAIDPYHLLIGSAIREKQSICTGQFTWT